MSNFNFNAKNKKTGEIVSVNAYDDYFAKHKYAYGIKNKILSEEEFNRTWIPCDCVYKSAQDLRILGISNGIGCGLCKGTGKVNKDIIRIENVAK